MKLIFYAVAFLFLASLAMFMFWRFVSALYWFGWMLFWLGLLAFMFFLAFSLLKPKLPDFLSRKKVEHKIKDSSRPYVYAFRHEPELKDVIMLSDELHVAQLELAGDVIQLNNDTSIKVLEDTGKEAVKVEIKGTKDKEKVFWVSRSAVFRAEQYKSDL